MRPRLPSCAARWPGFAALDLRIATGQRAQVLWLLAFAVTIWVSILAGALAD
ncbi:MAG: hypothetical protein MUE34_14355 [Acidimicrobiales bacterium]|nr:hypothetical protein [Acidimicrobiales bacterium]